MSVLFGHEAVGIRLLQLPNVRAHAGIRNNLFLRKACRKGMFHIVELLLQISDVRADATIYDNLPLRMAQKHHHLRVEALLLQIQQ